METRQHPQLLPVSVVAETDLTPVNQSITSINISDTSRSVSDLLGLTACSRRCWQTGRIWWGTSGFLFESASWKRRHLDAPQTLEEPERRRKKFFSLDDESQQNILLSVM